jgi:hypothetical protein
VFTEAKAAYPDRLEDVNASEQLTTHCNAMYRMDEEKAEEVLKMYASGLDGRRGNSSLPFWT